MKPLVDIAVLTSNARESLRRCLAALRRNTRGVPCRITVVDNGSGDGTAALLAQTPGIRVIRSRRNLGIAGGMNLALAEAAAPYFVKLDDDARVRRGWLSALLREARRSRKVGIVGCKILFEDGRIDSADFFAGPTAWVEPEEADRGQRDYVKTCDMVSGACMLIRRSLVRAIGPFDTSLPSHLDTDYCLRARLAGWRVVYTGRASAVHEHLHRWRPRAAQGRRKFDRKWGTLSALPLRREGADFWMIRARELVAQGRPAEALRAFRRVPSQMRNRALLGFLLERAGRLREAAAAYRRALRHDRVDLAALFGLSSLPGQNGRVRRRRIGRILEALARGSGS